MNKLISMLAMCCFSLVVPLMMLGQSRLSTLSTESETIQTETLRDTEPEMFRYFSDTGLLQVNAIGNKGQTMTWGGLIRIYGENLKGLNNVDVLGVTYSVAQPNKRVDILAISGDQIDDGVVTGKPMIRDKTDSGSEDIAAYTFKRPITLYADGDYYFGYIGTFTGGAVRVTSPQADSFVEGVNYLCLEQDGAIQIAPLDDLKVKGNLIIALTIQRPSGIQEILLSDGHIIYPEGGSFYQQGAYSPLKVYDMTGSLVNNKDLPSGTYMIVTEVAGQPFSVKAVMP